jgi:uncharacterized membrane protein HdeD (DUF308 family)
MEEKMAGQPWWVVLVEGIVALVTGGLLLISPERTMALLVLFMGIFWLVAGIIEIVSIFSNKSKWGLKLIIGLVGIGAGILVLRHPLWSTAVTTATLIVILGFYGLVAGVSMLVRAFRGGGWGIGILGVMAILIGIFLLANTWIGIQLTVTLAGITLVIGGIAAIAMSFRMDDSSPGGAQL